MDIFGYRVELVFGGHSSAEVERAQAWRPDMPGLVLHSVVLCLLLCSTPSFSSWISFTSVTIKSFISISVHSLYPGSKKAKLLLLLLLLQKGY